MASAGGRVQATDEIPEVGIGIVDRPPEDLWRIGSKRVRDSLNGMGSHVTTWHLGFSGVTTFEKKAAIASAGTSEIGGRYLHGTHGEQMLPDSIMSRSSISSPGENLGQKISRPTKICTLYAQGRCNKGNSCIFLHEIEGSGSGSGSGYWWNNEERAGLLAADAYGNSRGSVEGSQVRLSNFRVPQFKDSDGSTKDNLYRSLIHGYVDKRSAFTPGILQSAADKGAYLDMNSDSNHRYRSFDLRIPSDPLQCNEKFPGGTTGNLPIRHHMENLSSHAPYSSCNLPDFKNPLYSTSDHSFRSPTVQATSHLGRLSHHLSPPVIEKVGNHKYVDVGACTSRPSLLPSSSPQPSIVSPGSVSPIKDEVWVTSVPFVPSFDIPDIKTPTRTLYDPFVHYIDSPKDGNTKNLKLSIISSQHKNSYVPPKSLNHDDKSARNISAKLSTESACLLSSNKGHSSSMDDYNRVNVYDRKPNATRNSENTRDFRFRLAEHVKELIRPVWKEGYLSKDAHKQVVKKSMDKILSSIEPHQIPTSEVAISSYITSYKSKIERLVKAYVDMHRKA